MFNNSCYSIDKINFISKKSNFYPKYNNKKISFYIKDTFNVTPISEYKGKYNILVKMDENTKTFIKDIEKKFMEENNIDKDDYIPLYKEEIIKLKIYNHYKKLSVEVFDEDKKMIGYQSLGKNSKIKCLIEINNFWNYNGKYGMIIYVKKIFKLY
jgi:hypothetical protein